jgi:hypothetical protein
MWRNGSSSREYCSGPTHVWALESAVGGGGHCGHHEHVIMSRHPPWARQLGWWCGCGTNWVLATGQQLGVACLFSLVLSFSSISWLSRGQPGYWPRWFLALSKSLGPGGTGWRKGEGEDWHCNKLGMALCSKKRDWKCPATCRELLCNWLSVFSTGWQLFVTDICIAITKPTKISKDTL